MRGIFGFLFLVAIFGVAITEAEQVHSCLPILSRLAGYELAIKISSASTSQLVREVPKLTVGWKDLVVGQDTKELYRAENFIELDRSTGEGELQFQFIPEISSGIAPTIYIRPSPPHSENPHQITISFPRDEKNKLLDLNLLEAPLHFLFERSSPQDRYSLALNEVPLLYRLNKVLIESFRKVGFYGENISFKQIRASMANQVSGFNKYTDFILPDLGIEQFVDYLNQARANHGLVEDLHEVLKDSGPGHWVANSEWQFQIQIDWRRLEQSDGSEAMGYRFLVLLTPAW